MRLVKINTVIKTRELYNFIIRCYLYKCLGCSSLQITCSSSNKSPQKNHYTVFTHTFRIGYLQNISGFFFQNKSRTTILPSLLPRILYTPREQW